MNLGPQPPAPNPQFHLFYSGPKVAAWFVGPLIRPPRGTRFAAARSAEVAPWRSREREELRRGPEAASGAPRDFISGSKSLPGGFQGSPRRSPRAPQTRSRVQKLPRQVPKVFSMGVNGNANEGEAPHEDEERNKTKMRMAIRMKMPMKAKMDHRSWSPPLQR